MFENFQQIQTDNNLVENSKKFNKVCHEFEYSILFFLVVSVVIISFFIYGMVLVTKRRNFIFYGFDIIHSILFLCGAIR